ncbi:MAG: fatty acid desaturase [Pseudomonadota bacterium]
MTSTKRAIRTERARVELPTLLAILGCYAVWGLSLWSVSFIGLWACVPLALTTAFHSSLQHEVCHGHPTRNSLINEALVFPALGLAIAYRRFRDLHLKHHNDDRLTDPYDDPESFYVPEWTWTAGQPVLKAILAFNATFTGRMLIGPALALFGFWRSEIRLMRAGDRRVQGAWVRHVVGAIPVLLLVWAVGLPIWAYVLLVAWPAMSLIMVRSYIEHRAAEDPAERTAIVQTCGFWRLIFLNNNYHVLHHQRPALPWYRLHELWKEEGADILQKRGGYLVPGYGAVMREWAVRRREPIVHPLDRRQDGTPAARG